jgi:Flp pilus assembly pilin Flp
MNLLSLCSLCVKQFWRDKRGQDLIEYALLVGFVAVAAGAVIPNLGQNISVIFSKVGSVMTNAQNANVPVG